MLFQQVASALRTLGHHITFVGAAEEVAACLFSRMLLVAHTNILFSLFSLTLCYVHSRLTSWSWTSTGWMTSKSPACCRSTHANCA